MTGSVRILGIDPGSVVTGFGVVDASGNSIRVVDFGCIRAKGSNHTTRLRNIFDGLARVAEEHGPAEVAVERVFMHKNADSALKLGQARAAALCATFGVNASVHEYAPRQVKQSVVGFGAADKTQVQAMVATLLGLRPPLQADAADALAVALCHAHLRRMAAVLQKVAAQ